MAAWPPRDRRVERFVRQGDDWMFSETGGLGASVPLESIDVRLSLAEIYDKALPLHAG